jgi:hypothetical protein
MLMVTVFRLHHDVWLIITRLYWRGNNWAGPDLLEPEWIDPQTCRKPGSVVNLFNPSHCLVVWNIFYFSIVYGNVIIPTDELVFFKMVKSPPTRLNMSLTINQLFLWLNELYRYWDSQLVYTPHHAIQLKLTTHRGIPEIWRQSPTSSYSPAVRICPGIQLVGDETGVLLSFFSEGQRQLYKCI